MPSRLRNFQILKYMYLTKKCVLKVLGKLKIIKAPAGYELMTCIFVAHTLITLCCLITIMGKKNIIKMILDFIVYFNRKYVTIWRCMSHTTLIYFIISVDLKKKICATLFLKRQEILGKFSLI